MIIFVALFAAMTVADATTTKTYNGTLKIKVSVLTSTQKGVNVYYDDNGGKGDRIRMENTVVNVAGQEIAVGNITVVDVKNENGKISSSSNGTDNNILLSDGNDASMEWIGSSIGGVQGDVTGTMTADGMTLSIPLKVSKISMSITFEGKLSSTGIKDVNAGEKASAAYSVTGVRVSPDSKGLVIMNGKKFVNK